MGLPRQEHTGMGSYSLLQGIFPVQSLALQTDSLPPEPPGKPTLELDTYSTWLLTDQCSPDPAQSTFFVRVLPVLYDLPSSVRDTLSQPTCLWEKSDLVPQSKRKIQGFDNNNPMDRGAW